MNLESIEKKIYREHRSCSVVVITLASHARGPRFEPGQKQLILNFSNNWSPILNISKLMISFVSFLTDPNPDHALNPDRAKQLKINPQEYFKTG